LKGAAILAKIGKWRLIASPPKKIDDEKRKELTTIKI